MKLIVAPRGIPIPDYIIEEFYESRKDSHRVCVSTINVISNQEARISREIITECKRRVNDQ